MKPIKPEKRKLVAMTCLIAFWGLGELFVIPHLPIRHHSPVLSFVYVLIILLVIATKKFE